MHLLFSDNTAWGLFNFRRAIIRHFVEQGCRVSVCAPYHEDYFRKFRHMGCEPHAIDIDCHGVNPLKDATLLMNYLRLMRRLKPDVSFTYTIKPNLYAGIAAQCLHIPYIALVPGAGQAFIRHTPVTTVVRTLYKVAFRHARQVWFLNSDDAELFRRERLVAKDRIRKMDGEGIDLTAFPLIKEAHTQRPFTFIFIGRLLMEKGIGYFVEAARYVKQEYPEVRFRILGMTDSTNKNAVTLEQITTWQNEGIVEYLGAAADVRPYLSEADCLVLPSYYREGIPRSLMEGAAMGLPLITTDNTGCREVVRDGVNGFLCKARDAVSLADAMKRMIGLSAEERQQMGLRGRRLMEERFDIRLIIKRYDEAVRLLLKK